MQTANALLEVTAVSFAYDRTRTVLDNVSVSLRRGTILGLLGPNGSGKTTLLRLLSGTIVPASGRITIDGTPLAALPRRALARRIAVVPQETHSAFDFSALEIVLMGRYPHLSALELEGAADVAIAREAMRATGTDTFATRPFATLSGGEKQRVVIAAALAQISPGSDRDAGILLLDEPTAALDLAYQLEVAALLRDLQQRTPIAIVVSTHDLNFAAGLCRTLVLLKDGLVLAAGPTDEVLTKANIRALYGVEAEIQSHGGAGHLVVVPIRRVPPEARG